MNIRKKIKKIEFGLFSSKDIKKLSVARIYTPNTYDDDGYPVEGGLMDPRLGVIDPGLRCKSCGSRMGECQGHFGHVQLTRPVIHVGYAKEVYTLLRATCRSCGKLLKPQEDIDEYLTKLEEKDFSDETRGEIWTKSMKVTDNNQACPHCQAKQIKIKFVRPYSYFEDEANLLVTDVRERFEKITDQELSILGLKIRPEWVILDAIPVLPITTRPSITLESADRSEDDLTHKLVDILRINQRLEENINSGAPQLIIEDLWDLLQYHVATYFDNGITGIPPARHRSGRPLKTIAQRLKGKEGRFRNNLSGKRVNFSARTVVSPDPNLSINEVGVPLHIAMELTVPEEVNDRNIEKIRGVVRNGPAIHPGAYNIVSLGRRKRIMEETKEEIAEALVPGDQIERHLMDGDIVLFNRQPSLHRQSMMSHTVRVLPFNTFRLNTAVCAPYNADFDGDEMNLHVPQSEEAIAEADILMKVQENIISPRFGKPIIGGRHDHVTGMYLLTRKSIEMSRQEALQLTRTLLPLPPGKTKFTGRELFSLLIPKDLTLSFHSKFQGKHKDEPDVIIKNGQLKAGIIDSEGMEGALLNEIFIKYGSDRAREFIDVSTMLSIRAFMKFGFSVGIDEGDLNEKTEKDIKKLLEKAEDDTDELINSYKRGELRTIPGKSLEESLEDYIMVELGKSRTQAGNLAAESIGENSAVIMAKSGARGSMLNLTQMSGSVGQQAVRGKRIKRGYHDRTLSHFQKGDVSAPANGFVKSCFKSGLEPTEYFFHSMGGREGLVDTAIRTGRSGYMQRRLINALQDLVVYPDLTVRGDGGIITQFIYGEDGIDPMKKGYEDPKKSAVVPGEAVGTVAAQSIGEPGTQMTLRTFHYAGVVELSVPLGLPRLIEIIDAKRSPKMPIMTIFLDEEHRQTKKKATEIADQLDEKALKDFCEIKVDLKKKELYIKVENEEAKKAVQKILGTEDNTKSFKVEKEKLSDLQKLKQKIEKKRMTGLKGIIRTFVRRKGDEYVIYAEGSNLEGVLEFPGVDPTRTTTNDIYQVYETLGIEAGRSAIVEEATKVLEDQNLDVDIRHIMLVADQMTVTGELQAVGRQGISGSKGSVLARAAFEETEKHIMNAALFGEVDPLEGVTENIIVGQPIPMGTGMVELSVKPEMFTSSSNTPMKTTEKVKPKTIKKEKPEKVQKEVTIEKTAGEKTTTKKTTTNKTSTKETTTKSTKTKKATEKKTKSEK
ncbi:MAG: DNA-directed RNA polymerase subunit A' [Candidatus Altiarchaeota archaeon]